MNPKAADRSIRIASQLLLDDCKGYRLYIAKGLFERAKDWIKEKWTGFKEFDLEKESKAIEYIKYNKSKKILEIKYKERGTYQYAPVPEKVIEKMIEAPSKGKFLNKSIKRKYKYRKIAFVLTNEQDGHES